MQATLVSAGGAIIIPEQNIAVIIINYLSGWELSIFPFVCEALKQGSITTTVASLATKSENGFLMCGYTKCKDAAGEKQGGFPIHERSQVG